MRALEPRRHGYVTRDGVRLHWELFGEGKTSVFLLPTWSIVNSRHWKLQVPFLARQWQVLTMDGRGSGQSDRPVDTQSYGDAAFVADAFAVMDAVGIERTAVAGLSLGGLWAVMMAALQPQRVTSLALIGPAAWVVPPDPGLIEAVGMFEDALPAHPGWHRWNAGYWMSNYPDFVQFFMERCLPEPHSTKQLEDAVGWGLETTPEVLVAIERAVSRFDAIQYIERVRCPVLIVHGDRDEVVPLDNSIDLAGLLHATLVVVKGSGHLPHARYPVRVNLALRDFLQANAEAPAPGRESISTSALT
jgi:pimeloyl-ACP methyl ester carboxylesterase